MRNQELRGLFIAVCIVVSSVPTSSTPALAPPFHCIADKAFGGRPNKTWNLEEPVAVNCFSYHVAGTC